MNQFATPDFWYPYRQLPDDIRDLADRCFAALAENPRHPSTHLKKVGVYWSARVGRGFRVMAKERLGGLVWFWIGPHDRYDQLLAKRR